jgi:hypothetical protein
MSNSEQFHLPYLKRLISKTRQAKEATVHELLAAVF